MDLQEEYYLRHNLDHQLIRFMSDGWLLFKVNSSRKSINTRWKFFNVKNQNKDGDPGRYVMMEFIPVHNAWCKSRMFAAPNELQWNDKCIFDDYEDFMLHRASILRDNGYVPVIEHNELMAGLWEYFIFSFDGNFSRLPLSLAEILLASLDFAAPIDERNKKSESLRSIVFENQSILGSQISKTLSSSWMNLLSYTDDKSYATWLADLITGKRRVVPTREPTAIIDPEAHLEHWPEDVQ